MLKEYIITPWRMRVSSLYLSCIDTGSVKLLPFSLYIIKRRWFLCRWSLKRSAPMTEKDKLRIVSLLRPQSGLQVFLLSLYWSLFYLHSKKISSHFLSVLHPCHYNMYVYILQWKVWISLIATEVLAICVSRTICFAFLCVPRMCCTRQTGLRSKWTYGGNDQVNWHVSPSKYSSWSRLLLPNRHNHLHLELDCDAVM